jgi:hypothetical protein
VSAKPCRAIHDKAASLAVAILRCSKQQIAKDVLCGTIPLFGAEKRQARWLGSNPVGGTARKKTSSAEIERCETLKEIQINEGNVEKSKLDAIIIRATASLPKKT